MNNKLIILTKILLKNGFGLKAEGKKKIRQIFFMILIGLCFIPVISGIAMLVSILYDSFETIGQQGVVLSLGIAASSFTIFFFGVFYVINVFYFSNDVENLLPLPLKPSQIIGAKFLVTVVYEYITEAFILLPVLIVYAIKSEATFLFYIYSLIVFLLVPIVPLVLASVLVMIIMRFTGIARNRDRFRMVGGLIAMFGALGFNVVIQRFTARNVSPEELQQMFTQGKNSMVEITSRIFPGAKFGAESLVYSADIQGLINLLIFVLLSIVAFILVLYIGEFLYLRGVVGISEMAAKRKKVSSDELGRLSERKSKLKSYTLKELKLLFRTPVYFMNCVLMNFIWPIIMLIPMFSQPEGMGELQEIGEVIKTGNYGRIIIAVGFAVAMFISATNSVTSTSISREGQNLYISKYIPVSYKTQIMAKVLSGVLISLIGLTSILIAATIIFKLPIQILIMLAIIGMVGIFFVSLTGVLIDLYNPKLHWDNEQKAVKQNLNVVFNMLIGVIFAGLTVWGTLMSGAELLVIFLAILIGFGIIDILVYKLVLSKGEKLYGRIEA